MQGWTILVYEFATTSNVGIDITTEPRVIVPNSYFNGLEYLYTADSGLLANFDLRIEGELHRNFTVEGCRAEFVFYGDLYHNTKDDAKVCTILY